MQRSILIPLIIAALSATVVWADQLVSKQEFQVVVAEAILVGEQTTTTLTLYPGETEQVEVIITNLSDNPLPIEIDATVTPANGILVADPGMVEVPADGEPHSYFVAVTADTDIPVGEYTLTIEIKRE